MPNSEPMDYRLGRRAYEAFYSEQPQIWFSDLAHTHQMRWVNAAREVLKEALKGGNKKPNAKTARYKDPNPITSVSEAHAVLKNIPVKPGGRKDYTNVSSDQVRRAKNALKYLRKHR